jgi:phosphosulfolactate phosphohydrolase-like enzyme
VEAALKFKAETPNVLAAGKVDGFPPQGLDFGNSSTQTTELDLTGRFIVQSTGAEAKGGVRSVRQKRCPRQAWWWRMRPFDSYAGAAMIP